MTRRALITGVANEDSLAWYTARALHEQGWDLAFTYENEKTLKYTQHLFDSVGGRYVQMDVTSPGATDTAIRQLGADGLGFDAVLHSIAGGPSRDDLNGSILKVSHDSLLRTLNISAVSLHTIVASLDQQGLLNDGASVLSFTYLGSQRVVPNYGVVGVAKAALEALTRELASALGWRAIRVNAISASPVQTRAASGIGGFYTLARDSALRSPLGHNVTKQEVAATAEFLLGNASSGITGQVVYVDAGTSINF